MLRSFRFRNHKSFRDEADHQFRRAIRTGRASDAAA
jgi:AAA15 family ATPase/GTPase